MLPSSTAKKVPTNSPAAVSSSEAVSTAMTEGKDAALDRVAIRRALPWVEIASAEPLTLNLDGEPVEATSATAALRAGPLVVVVVDRTVGAVTV